MIDSTCRCTGAEPVCNQLSGAPVTVAEFKISPDEISQASFFYFIVSQALPTKNCQFLLDQPLACALILHHQIRCQLAQLPIVCAPGVNTRTFLRLTAFTMKVMMYLHSLIYRD